ncbi:MAG: hypothetical protein OEW35_10595 [Gammaproteobacteria bacterium]|nr:hypothetical protein [Gammaproteobacteria bacterium]MDH4254526.1 hypothetical protein [Gammaproteobacteria bacterium]MDH5309576.1 hypothetical protein [Gammaproteobacteria bacterium]
MKRTALALVACVAPGLVAPVAADELVSTYISAAAIEATIAAAPPGEVSDQQIRHVEAPQANLGVGIVRRPAMARGEPIRVIRHHNQSEVYRVVSGRGTLVTMMAAAGEEPLDPDGVIVRTLTGPSSVGLAGGPMQEQEIGPGDVVIIPAGLAHGFSEIVGEITYLVVRIDPDRLVELK